MTLSENKLPHDQKQISHTPSSASFAWGESTLEVRTRIQASRTPTHSRNSDFPKTGVGG